MSHWRRSPDHKYNVNIFGSCMRSRDDSRENIWCSSLFSFGKREWQFGENYTFRFDLLLARDTTAGHQIHRSWPGWEMRTWITNTSTHSHTHSHTHVFRKPVALFVLIASSTFSHTWDAGAPMSSDVRVYARARQLRTRNLLVKQSVFRPHIIHAYTLSPARIHEHHLHINNYLHFVRRDSLAALRMGDRDCCRSSISMYRIQRTQSVGLVFFFSVSRLFTDNRHTYCWTVCVCVCVSHRMKWKR